MIQLHPFQQHCKEQVYAAWNAGARDVLMVLPTGAGKTVVFADIIHELNMPTVAIAHRQEIVSQMSLALARNGVRHRVIGPRAVARTCTSLHLNELNRNYVDPTSVIAVAGVDTLTRMDKTDPWFKTISLTVDDEAHHELRDNKWGAARNLFPQALGLGVTATPCRADGRGLGRKADGYFDTMVIGPGMRDLIDAGWLCDYRLFEPPSDLDLSSVPHSAGGDFSPRPLAEAVHKSRITGDVVKHYLRIAAGKRGITFCVDVAAATETAAAYRAAGVPAEVVSAKTPDLLRSQLLRKLKTGELLQLVNVDLFGEGMDIPAIEVVSMVRPTESYSLYAQQFGRALRTLEGKEKAIIVDHVGNRVRHGLPDRPRVWSLDRREKRSQSAGSDFPLKVCAQCTSPREAYLKICPYCGYENVPAVRSAPHFVDGDLYELDPSVRDELLGKIDAPPLIPYGADPIVVNSIKKAHREKCEAQFKLRMAIASWAGRYTQSTEREAVSELQRRFYHTFGVDVATAQTLNRRDTEELLERVSK